MDVTSLYTNIPQEEGIEIVCRTYETFYGNELPIPTHFLREMLRLILPFFNGKNYLQTHGTAMGTKMAVSFANILMAEVETDIINQSPNKPLIWTTSFLYGTQTKRQYTGLLWDLKSPKVALSCSKSP